jgi:glycosyltransferase involved in cell wall biosynthesis
MKYKYSIILCTRKRVEKLDKLLESIFNTAKDKTGFDIWIKVDNDDKETLNNMFILQEKYISSELYEEYKDQIQFVIGDREGGYRDIWKFQNKLSELCSGDIIISLSDDITILTTGWDEILEQYLNRLCVLKFSTMDAFENSIIYFAIHRKVIEITGHFSLNTHTDTWWEKVGRECGIEIKVPIFINHPKFNDPKSLEGDITAKESGESLGYTTSNFHSIDMQEARREDIRLIQEYIHKNGVNL